MPFARSGTRSERALFDKARTFPDLFRVGRIGVAKRYQVIVVGGGPVGVALAVDLGLRGISCALVETRAGLSSDSKGPESDPAHDGALPVLGRRR